VTSRPDPTIFSYVVAQDSGFAPNPYGGFLTLATCKPLIRKAARPDDWLLGTGSAGTVGNDHLVYAAEIAEVIPIDIYGSDPAYSMKRPKPPGDERQGHGDNIYYRNELGRWARHPHSRHTHAQMRRDLQGKNVLICSAFWYFGRNAPPLPPFLLQLVKKGPGHRRINGAEFIPGLKRWLSRKRAGVAGDPYLAE